MSTGYEVIGAVDEQERRKFYEHIAQIQEARKRERELWQKASEDAIAEASRVAAGAPGMRHCLAD